jgi:hypothetical protein
MDMSLATNRSGKIRISTLLLLVVLAAGVYCGVAFGKVYWHRYKIQDAIDRQLSFGGQLVDESIRQRLSEDLAGMNLPPAARNVQVTRTSPRTVEVSIKYTETVNLLFTKKQIPVSIREERTY